MTSSRKLELTDEARKDLRSIPRTSRKHWGERQRDLYARRLTESMELLTAFPHLGEARAGLPSGMRAPPVERHVIYYRVGADSISVIRLLHQSMDAPAHLGP